MAALTTDQVAVLRVATVPESGNRVNTALRLAGLTQQEAAALMGETQPYVSDVARGRYQTITVAKAQKFAALFGCQIEDLFPAREALA